MFCNNKCIIWLKKYGKGRREWNKAYIEVGLRPRKKTRLVLLSYIMVFNFFVYLWEFLCLFVGILTLLFC
jgi:hypothetical protein